MARPPKPADEVRSQVLQLRLTIGEREMLDAGAKLAGKQLTQFIRDAALDRAAKVAGRGRKGRGRREP